MNKSSNPLVPLPPPACIGILGGGQLGRMLAQAAHSMGYQTAVLDPEPHSPAAQISHFALEYAYDDPRGIERLASLTSRVTTEFENVPAKTLEQLSQRVEVRPSAFAVAVAQDRIVEKKMILDCALQTAPFHAIFGPEDVTQAPQDLFPGLLKTARLGYDGKGQVQVQNTIELQKSYAAMNAEHQRSNPSQNLSCVLEKKLPLLAEYSVIVARNELGHMVHLPLQCNQHINGILHLSTVFKHHLPQEMQEALILAAQTIAQKLHYVGVLCVEFFVLTQPLKKGGTINWVVNEIAPRPHNSGHHSLDSCDVSQFELQLRTLCGLPLVKPRQHSPCVMLNLLGDLWFNSSTNDITEPPWQDLLALPGTHLHLYGKAQPRKARKMGHLNITGERVQDILMTLQKCLSLLKLPALSADFLNPYLHHDH